MQRSQWGARAALARDPLDCAVGRLNRWTRETYAARRTSHRRTRWARL